MTLLGACSVPIEAGLDDAEANRVFVALDHASVEVSKEPDPGSEGKWRVAVGRRGDVARALAVLRDEGLPRRASNGAIADSLNRGSLVPSEAAEHAELVAATAAELERSLQSIDGVLVARVHLSVPEASPLRDLAPPRGTASVLVEHRGDHPPPSVPTPSSASWLGASLGISDHRRGRRDGAASFGALAWRRAISPMWGRSLSPGRRFKSFRRLSSELVSASFALLAATTLMLYSRLGLACEGSQRHPSPPL